MLQGTFPDPMRPAANSIVCTEETDMLRQLFNESHSPVRSIKFPAKKCQTAISRCEQCLTQLRCASSGIMAAHTANVARMLSINQLKLKQYTTFN